MSLDKGRLLILKYFGFFLLKPVGGGDVGD